ncbi:IclR family transcriptional regulator [Breznakiella homolactica]|uniref:IclR family transcriptional regulator n=1 Tax=Breznakiella homolactica TaxID=2798577 RepID=A0A7T7XM86_9SPIR|nr:IclR family transcriptional regulator [Breznakiella homolactica]QQO08891.1 IclR family transcriptional regulator [Breznakiella homolactica]
MQEKTVKKNSEGTKKNQSLRKALHILEGMTTINGAARLQDIAQKLNMPQSTLLRFLNTYIDFGYVGHDPNTQCYYLTLKLAELGSRAKDNFPFQSSLSKYVKEIARTFNESASLCIEHDMQMVYIATEEGPGRMLQTLQRIGRIAPMHATGVGKLHLMNYSDSRLSELEKRYGLGKYTEHTITDMESLKREIVKIREQGYAVDDEECEDGVRCVAVPVRDFSNAVIAGISLSAPITRLDLRKMDEIIKYLKDISVQASRELGCEL